MHTLEDFIIEAKSCCYVGGGEKQSEPCRTGSHDLRFRQADFSYMDSYFGGSDFIGQEIVWHEETPVWGMNYYGKILKDDAIDAKTAARIITTALQALYRKGRFLGGFELDIDGFLYRDQSKGNYQRFTGIETISRNDIIVYQLDYHGGMIRP